MQAGAAAARQMAMWRASCNLQAGAAAARQMALWRASCNLQAGAAAGNSLPQQRTVEPMDVVLRLLNGLLMLALPLGLGVVLVRRLGQRWGLLAVGAATFIAAQALHLPFNLLLLNPRLQLGNGQPTVAAAALLGLSAGVFEESARYLALRFWRREARSWGQALMLGAGHGGVESFLLGVVVLLTLFQMIAYRGADLAALFPVEQLPIARQQIEAYWAAPAPLALLGALERLFALGLHLSLSVMVMRAFTHRNHWWLAAAVGWHALVDGMAVLSLPQLGAVATEAILGVLALISVGLIYRLRVGMAPAGEAQFAPAPEGTRPWAPAPAEREAIERTRYSDG